MLSNLIMLQAAQGGGWSGIVMIVAMIAIFSFMMIRPQQKKQKEMRLFREGIKKGDSVISAGGIYGKVKEVQETSILMNVADGVTIRIDKNSVYPTAAEAQADAETKAKA